MSSSRNRYHAFDEPDWFDAEMDRVFEESYFQMMNTYSANVENTERPLRSRRRHRRNENPERRPDRDREAGQNRLWNDYFAERPIYDDRQFRIRFRMDRSLFLRIVEGLQSIQYFQQRPDATGRMGFSPLQKCTAALRMLAYGSSADSIDEYLRIGASTSRQCLHNFCQGIIDVFGVEYLRKPTPVDMQRLLHIGENRGFPGMIGSIDCMHWEWKNCPAALKGMYQGREGVATLILEAVASQDLWISHAFFGTPGSCNDLNVLYRSPMFNDVLNGVAPAVQYSVNGHQYDMGYYLTDGIYPKWAAFIQSIPVPQSNKHKLFSQCQEAARKDVERAFGVLQARWQIIRNPALAWDKEILHRIMNACIIMHNMIVEDERINYQHYVDPSTFIAEQPESSNRMGGDNTTSTGTFPDMRSFFINRDQLRNRNVHNALKNDLIEHIWQRFGENDI